MPSRRVLAMSEMDHDVHLSVRMTHIEIMVVAAGSFDGLELTHASQYDALIALVDFVGDRHDLAGGVRIVPERGEATTITIAAGRMCTSDRR